MDYELDIIARKQIPYDIFLCGENEKDDFECIHKYQFNNGLTYIIGSYNYIESPKDFIENMEYEMQTVLENNSPDELQQYYKDNFNIFYYYKNCEKIWNYYKKNEQLIKQVIEYYNENNDVVDILTDNIEEGYSSN
jgi:hypothetical protein